MSASLVEKAIAGAAVLIALPRPRSTTATFIFLIWCAYFVGDSEYGLFKRLLSSVLAIGMFSGIMSAIPFATHSHRSCSSGGGMTLHSGNSVLPHGLLPSCRSGRSCSCCCCCG